MYRVTHDAPVSTKPLSLSTEYRHKMNEALAFATVNKEKRTCVEQLCNVWSIEDEGNRTQLSVWVCVLSGEHTGADDCTVAVSCHEQ